MDPVPRAARVAGVFLAIRDAKRPVSLAPRNGRRPKVPSSIALKGRLRAAEVSRRGRLDSWYLVRTTEVFGRAIYVGGFRGRRGPSMRRTTHETRRAIRAVQEAANQRRSTCSFFVERRDLSRIGRPHEATLMPGRGNEVGG